MLRHRIEDLPGLFYNFANRMYLHRGRHSYLLFILVLTSIFYSASASAVPAFYIEEGNAFFFRGKYSKAVLSYKKAIEESAGSAAVHLNCALAYRTLGNLKDTETHLRLALTFKPDDPDIRTELGWTLHHQQKLDEALTEFTAALNLQPGNFSAGIGIASVYIQKGETSRASELLDQLKSKRPTFAALYYFAGKNFERAGYFSSAQENFVTALQKDWTFAEIRPRLARIYKLQDKMEQAWKQYARAAELDPLDSYSKDSARQLERYIKTPSPSGPTPAHAKFSAAAQFTGASMKNVTVGLWASPSGRPPRVKKLLFSVNAPFTVQGTRSGKVFAQGEPMEIWKSVHQRGALYIESPDGNQSGPYKYAVIVVPQNTQSAILFHEAEDSNKKSLISSDGREFRGKMLFVPDGSRGFYPANEIGLEEYLLGVLPKEMPTHWPMESLKAQAIIARSYASLRMNSKSHRKKGFDLCDTQHCQVYGGIRAETVNGSHAVNETRGQLLYYKDNVANTYYHSNCGGHTRSSSEVPGWGNAGYLAGRYDSDDSGNPPRTPWEQYLWIKSDPEANFRLPELVGSTEYRWLRVVPADTLARKLRKRWRIGVVKAVIPLARDSSGHVQEVLIRGSRRDVVITSEHEIRHYLGLDSLRSTLFVVETMKDPSGVPTEFWFYGGGWGHSIGICQSGAAGLALRRKFTAEQILQFYYAGTSLKPISE